MTLSLNCENFQSTVNLEIPSCMDMLHDRLVCRCKDQRLQCKLLVKPDLTFDKAFKMAKVMEAAEKEAKDLQDTPPTAVNQLGKVGTTKQNPRIIPNPCPIH